MHTELEKLIDLALADGILTDNKKQVLYKKASEFGVGKDEFDVILQDKLQKSEKLFKQIIKCPQCGEPIYGLTKVCSACGFILNNQKVINDGLGNLDDAIITLQHCIVQIKSLPDITFIDRIKSAFHIYLLIFVVGTAIMMIQDKEYFGSIFLIALGLGGFWVYKKYFLTKKNSIQKLIAETEKQKELIMIYYGENNKVFNYIKKLEDEILKVKNERLSKIRRTNRGCLTAIAVIIVIYLLFMLAIFYFLKYMK